MMSVFFELANPNLLLLSGISLFSYIACFALSMKHGDSFRVRIFDPDFCFYIFFGVVFYLPYFSYLVVGTDVSDSLYVQETFVETSNKALSITNIGLISFFLGFCVTRKIRIFTESNINFARRFFIATLFLQIVSIILFLLSGNAQLMLGAYAGSNVGSAAENGIYFLCTIFGMCTASVFFLERHLKETDILSYVGLFLNFSWMIFLLLAGDRNSFLLIAFVYTVVLCRFFIKINLFVLGVVATLFLATYLFVESYRLSEDKGVGAAAVSLSSSSSSGLEDFLKGSFNNSTIVTRAMFESAEEHGIFYGKFKLIGFAGIFPFSRQLIVDPSDPYPTSAELMTDTILGVDSTWSIGSNLIADIYLDFGMLGIPICFFLLGYVSRIFTSPYAGSATTIIVHSIWASFMFQISRYALDFPVRGMVWILLLMLIVNSISRKNDQENI